MQIGLKVGPANWHEVLSQVTPECAEVWFRLDWAARVEPIYAALHERKVSFGIHFWAITSEGFEPNLAIEQDGLAAESIDLIKQTLDIAATVGASYVNVHPGGLRRKYLDLNKGLMVVLDKEPEDVAAAERTLLDSAVKLQAYAQKKNVLLLFETLPRHECVNWAELGREQIQMADNISTETLLKLGENGYSLTNDLGHTLASYPHLQGLDLQNKLVEMTEKLAPFTKLIHLNTVCPPFNGTDSHNGILPQDYALDVIPNEETTKQLLAQFQAREDVWVILEAPVAQMVQNYEVLSRWKAENFLA
jgi:hypothetical protein